MYLVVVTKRTPRDREARPRELETHVIGKSRRLGSRGQPTLPLGDWPKEQERSTVRIPVQSGRLSSRSGPRSRPTTELTFQLGDSPREQAMGWHDVKVLPGQSEGTECCGCSGRGPNHEDRPTSITAMESAHQTGATIFFSQSQVYREPRNPSEKPAFRLSWHRHPTGRNSLHIHTAGTYGQHSQFTLVEKAFLIKTHHARLLFPRRSIHGQPHREQLSDHFTSNLLPQENEAAVDLAKTEHDPSIPLLTSTDSINSASQNLCASSFEAIRTYLRPPALHHALNWRVYYQKGVLFPLRTQDKFRLAFRSPTPPPWCTFALLH
ncbi:hypothetical protein HPB51_012714 [Rhipicephalus microplus]|uniref:Uncharacterized protein n=1 Tax=Rhipicephalus microplus TaxID=6941 RepID=A0A9J6EGS6_RHIMP|nr:hypothetical protein HPB51_012714 [Rhipicephalus microplus]